MELHLIQRQDEMEMQTFRQGAREYIKGVHTASGPSKPSSSPKFDELRSLSFPRLVEEISTMPYGEDVQRV